ncbi:attachment protein [Inoviridae sp.]|nr:attachment protein [Inoviridae sp.]
MKRLLILILFLLPISASSVTMPATPWYNTEGTTIYSPSGTVKYFTNKQASCDYYFTRLYGSGLYRLNSATVGSNNLCYLSFTNLSNGQTSYNSNNVMTAYGCLSGWTLSGTTCTNTTCPSGMTADASGVCVDPCSIIKDQTTSLAVNCSSNSFPASVCLPNNCAATSFNAAMGFDKTKNCYFGNVTVKLTGSSCSGEPSSASFTNPTAQQPPPPDTPEADCIKKGMSYGSVNGVAVCVPKSSTGATPITNTSSSSTNTTNTGTDGKQTNSSSSEVKNVTQDGDKVTSQIIKNNPDGTKSESTVVETFDDFCASNPNHKICKKASDDETPSSCEDNPDLPQCMQLGEPDDSSIIPTDTRTVTFTPVSITSGGACPADKSISIAGRSVTFSYSWLCQYASMFRPFMLALAYLSAAMFLFWGYKGAQT